MRRSHTAMRILALLVLLVLRPPAVAAPAAPQEQADGTPKQAQGNRDRHGPRDLESYIRRLESPKRLEYENPAEVIKALGIRPTDWIVDLGCGPGFYTLYLARAVPQGLVFALDVEPRQLDRLNQRLSEAKLANVLPVLTPPDDPRIPPGRADVILVVDTYHHFDNRPAYLHRLQRALKPDGRLVIIDFFKRRLPVGPPPPHKLARETVLSEVEAAGFTHLREHTFLKYHYFLEFGIQHEREKQGD